jgi:ABC-type branched-subunit amino acid transport system substrate-binding protein
VDLYNGIRLAVKKLQGEGTLINLFAYDVENDAATMQELVRNGPFQQMDLLIGPLYAESYKVAQAWAVEHDVPLVNPISTNRRLVEAAPNLFLAQPSLDQQAAAAAQFARQKFGTAPAVVFYGIDRPDSLLAAAYAAQLKQQNIEVLALRRNTMGSAETVAAAASLVGSKRIGHVFVASSQKGSGPAFLNALGRNSFGSVPVLLLAEGFTMSTVSASQFSGRDVYLLDPNFVDDEKPDVAAFQKNYLARYNTLPSSFAYWGYDLMLFYGRMLGKYGAGGLRDGVHRQPQREGYTLAGFDYTAANDNRAVPIVMYDDYKFVPVK